MEAQVRETESNLKAVLNIIPNMTHPDAPVGLLAEDNKEIKHWGQPRKFDFTPKDHVALCDSLQLADFEAGASVAGQKFYYLKNEGALLELALVQYAMNTLVQEGFIPVITPDLARIEVLEGIGFIPRDPDPEKRQVYTIADTDLCLVATAEITLGACTAIKFLMKPTCLCAMLGSLTASVPKLVHPVKIPEAYTGFINLPKSKCLPSAHPNKQKLSTSTSFASKKKYSKALAFAIGSLIPARAIWAGLHTENTISKLGCPEEGTAEIMVRLPALPTAPITNPVGSTFAVNPKGKGHSLRLHSQWHCGCGHQSHRCNIRKQPAGRWICYHSRSVTTHDWQRPDCPPVELPYFLLDRD